MQQLQGTALSSRRHRPREFRAITHFIHQNPSGIAQRQRFTPASQPADVRTHHPQPSRRARNRRKMHKRIRKKSMVIRIGAVRIGHHQRQKLRLSRQGQINHLLVVGYPRLAKSLHSIHQHNGRDRSSRLHPRIPRHRRESHGPTPTLGRRHRLEIESYPLLRHRTEHRMGVGLVQIPR